MHNFFSIIIPAHNEEKVIKNTLDFAVRQTYPKDLFEVLVIENGSTDATYTVAKSCESANVRVLQSEKGVSKAKNFGIAHVSDRSHWIIFLDADTEIHEHFLKELNEYLVIHQNKNLSVGTTTVLPLGQKRLYANAWFCFYNVGHMLTRTSFAIQIMNAQYKNIVSFDTQRKFAEDLKFIEDLRKHGSFFYFRTRQVYTSTRRFDEVGWFRLFLRWNWQALVLSKTKRATDDYHVIR